MDYKGKIQIVFTGCKNEGDITAYGDNTEVHASGLGSSQYSLGPWLVALNCENTDTITLIGGNPHTFGGALFAFGPYMTIHQCKNTGRVVLNGENKGEQTIGYCLLFFIADIFYNTCALFNGLK